MLKMFKLKNKIRQYIKEAINEINHIANNSPITICSLEDFEFICQNLSINDNNVEKYIGEYCFIEIGSSMERCKIDADNTDGYDRWLNNGETFYKEGQYYFNNEHFNVLHLEFDDNIDIGNKENGTTCITLPYQELKQDKRYNQNGTPMKLNAKKRFYYKAKGFEKEDAIKANSFIKRNLSKNSGVKFIIHCRMGQSRSAAMGYFIAKKLKINIESYLNEYLTNNSDGNYTSQFRLYNGEKGKRLMNHRVSTIMKQVDEKGDENFTTPKSFNTNNDYYDDLRNYIDKYKLVKH